MVMRWMALGLIAAIVAPIQAKADWQYTKWGMSQEQVIKASAGKVRRATEDERKQFAPPADLMGEYATGPFRVTVAFLFTRGVLTTVYMTLNDQQQGGDLVRTMRSKYGPSSDVSKTVVSTREAWRDKEAGNTVELYRLAPAGAVSVIYGPINSPGSGGL